MILTEKDIYNDYVHAYPRNKHNQISFVVYFQIITMVMKLIFERILLHGEVFVFPKIRFGFLSIVKSKPAAYYCLKNLPFDQKMRSKNKTLISQVSNLHTNGYQFTNVWDKRLSYCKSYRSRYYTWQWDSYFRKLMQKHIIKHSKDSDLESIDAPLKRL